MMLRALRIGLLSSTFLFAPSYPAQAEPISATIGLTAFLSTTLGLGAAGATIGGLIVTGAVAIGATLIQSALTPAPVAESDAQTSATKGSTLSVTYGGAVPRNATMGPSATAGHHIYTNVYGNNNNFLQCVFVVGDGKHGAITGLRYNDTVCTLSGTIGTSDYDVPEFFGSDGTHHVRIRWFSGDFTQAADNALVSNSNPSGRWTSNHRGRGVCYLSVTQIYNEELGLTGVPNVLIQHEGLMLYDPRKDSTNGGSGSHRWGNISTYEPSSNPVVQEYNFRRGIYINNQRILGMTISPTNLVLGMYFAAANVCDESVPLDGGGSELRFRASVNASDDRPPSDVLETLRNAMAGFTLERAGQFGPIPGVAQIPVTDLTFSDDDLEVGTPAPFSKYRSRTDVITAVHGRFSDPLQKWQTVSFPARENSSDDAVYGEKLAREVDLTQVYSSSQAQRIAEITRRRTLQQGKGSVTLGAKWIAAQPGDWIPFNSTRHGNMTVLITGTSFDPANHRITLTYEKTDNSVYTWTTAGEIARPPTPTGAATGGIITAAAGVTATVITHLGGNGASQPAIRFTWTPIFDSSVDGILFEVERVGDPGDAIQYTATNPASGQALLLHGILANTSYRFRHKLLTTPVRNTPWSSFATVGTGGREAFQTDIVETRNLINNSATVNGTFSQGSVNVSMDTSYTTVHEVGIVSSGTGRITILAMVDIVFSLDFDFSTKTLTDVRTCDVEYLISIDGGSNKTVYVPAQIYQISPTTQHILPRIMGTFVGSVTTSLSAGSHTVRLRARSRNSVTGKIFEVSGSQVLVFEGKKQS